MAGQSITVKLTRGDNTSWGFRLQGGKDFSTPLSVQRVNPGSLADSAGVISGDAILKICGASTDNMRHKEAQDYIMRAGNNLELLLQRGGLRVWKPTVTPIGDIPKPVNPSKPAIPSSQALYTKTSLAANKQEAAPIGSKHNVSARPFANIGGGKVLVNTQYNSPVPLYSMNNIAETLSAHTEVLSSGAKGINFMKDPQPVNKESAVYRMIMEENQRTDDFNHIDRKEAPVTQHVSAPITKPASMLPQREEDPNACVECGKSIIGVFVRIKGKSMHPDCFRCSTCGSSLKNVGYFSVNDKLYCDMHAKQAARVTCTTPTYEPITVSQMGQPEKSSPVPPPVLSPTPQTPISAPMSPTGYRSVSPTPFHKPTDMHHVEAPTSPVPLSSVTSPLQLKTSVPMQQPSFATPITPGKAPVFTSQQSYTSQPATANATTTPFSGCTVSSGGVMMSAGPGSRPSVRRGRGQMKPQVGAGLRIPICSICGSPIRGPFVTAMGKTWCPEHFICTNSRCRRALVEIGFVEHEGQLYCESCYEMHLAPICAKCATRIKGNCLNALNKQWHPECFLCAYCHKPFGHESFYMEDGLPYCEKDWNELFTTKCVGCGFPIEAGDRWVEALNNNYHSQCFKCMKCHKSLEGQSFYAKGGRPFCKIHAR